jgi:hypothetical protein
MLDENSVRIRLANLRDAEPLARLHYVCSSVQPGGFMHRLGVRFFVKYYQIILSERTSVVLCADAGRDGIVGLASATLDSAKQLEVIQKGRFKLFWSVIPALIRKPSLIWDLYIREMSFSASFHDEGFIVGSGARIAYWGWLPDYPQKGRSTYLLKELMHLMEKRGATEIQLEVDRLNRKVEVVHRLLGARVVREFTTSDGRARIVMEYKLNPKGGIA